MADLIEIEGYCNSLLNIEGFRDYCPNGLQVDAGRRTIRRLATAVSASLEVIEEAAAWGADLLLVHHGYFWKGEAEPLVGVKGGRVRLLIKSEISLMAYHLPLDAHPELGNNRGLGDALGLQSEPVEDDALLWFASMPDPISGDELAGRLADALGQPPRHLAAKGDIEKLVWCTGAAQGGIEKAAALGAQGYISGEVSEQTYHLARELGIHYFGAGHHATERFGVRALGVHLCRHFGIEHRFIDQENPF